MPSILCKCKERLRFGEIPNPIEWLIVSDKAYGSFVGTIDAEALYRSMNSILKCPKCGRLWVFWDGFDSDPSCYSPEKPE